MLNSMEKRLVSRFIKKRGTQVLNIIKSADEKIVVHYTTRTEESEYLHMYADIIKNRRLIRPPLPLGIHCILKNKDEIWLGRLDVYHHQINKGYGTILVKELIQFAQEHGYKTISGYMSAGESAEHRSRLRHFYSKLGFELQDASNFSMHLHTPVVAPE
ncbi:GNAT family N-acetyltransferase [Paenibacillus cremeus]|nr:GNAT family N-acetyltransferase [Paenibacillus cremeus]